MKKHLLLFFCILLFNVGLRAQSFIGYTYNNFEGASSVMFNPASIAGSNLRFDFNILSASTAIGTNAYTFDRASFLGLKFFNPHQGKDYHKVNSVDSKDLWYNMDVLGPSFMVSFSKKHSLAISSRFRFMVNEENLSNNIFQLIGSDKNSDFFGQEYTQKDFRLNLHGFADFGLTYARVLFENDNHKVKAGVTGKYVLGLASGSFKIDKMSVYLEQRNTKNWRIQADNAQLFYSKGVDAIIEKEIGNISDYFDARGVAFDFGAVYEWTSNSTRNKVNEGAWYQRTTYKLRAAFSATDIGSLRYSASVNSANFSVNSDKLNEVLNSNQINIKEGESLDQYIDRMRNVGFFTKQEISGKVKTTLPTLVRANVDWQAAGKFYVNVDGSFNTVGKNAVGTKYVSAVALTPRYESSWFSVYSPLSYTANKEKNWGLGFNFGVFYLGSGSILSNLMTSNIKNIDVHFGLRVPIFKSSPKKSRTVKQPVVREIVFVEEEPVEETPEEPVSNEMQDYVPKVVEVNPSDYVSIPDEGVDNELQKEVTILDYSIHFVKGSDWLLIESREPLNRVARILKDNPSYHIEVRGYTDNVGTEKANSVLSQQRADSVKKHLVEQGVAASRITAIGFGDRYPIADNDTESGKAKNRRVELILSVK